MLGSITKPKLGSITKSMLKEASRLSLGKAGACHREQQTVGDKSPATTWVGEEWDVNLPSQVQ